MQKGIKFRAYPNKEQKNLIDRTLGCCRLIYNKGLSMREDAYKSGEKVNYSQTSAMLTLVVGVSNPEVWNLDSRFVIGLIICR